LGDRRDDPQYFSARTFSAALVVHDERGNIDTANRLMTVLEHLHEYTELHGPVFHQVAVVFARRGDAARAWSVLGDRHEFGALISLASYLEAACEVAGEVGAWDRAEQILDDARTLSDANHVRALAAFADRLEGQLAREHGDQRKAADSLTRARDGFAALEARWEAAKTDVELARVHLLRDERTEATALIDTALQTFTSLGAVRSQQRARGLLEP
jgi:hypothetical protein